MTAHILVIEDEPVLRLGLVDALEAEGFRVSEAEDGELGLELALKEGPDAILLDLMLPKRDGFSVLRALRQDRLQSAVLILSARGEEWDRIQGFEVGADDYLVKPFSVPELLVRLRAALQRAEGRAPGLGEGPERTRIGVGLVDFGAYSVERNGESQGLSRKELDLLRYLLDHSGQTCVRDSILDAVWGRNQHPTPRTIDNFIAKLRKKLEPEPESPRHLMTVHGVGYRLDP